MNRTIVLLAAVSAFATSLLQAQATERPNFAGQWSTEAAAPAGGAPGGGGAPGRGAPGGGGGAPGGGRGAAAPSMGSGWGPTITITQTSAQMVVEYAVFARGDMQAPLKFTYVFGGSSSNTVMMGRGMQAQKSQAAWKGDTLVITTEHSFPDPASGKATPYAVTQSLTLASPTSLVVQTARPAILGGVASTTTTTYTKR
jgi:hypothetical protein